MHIFMILPVFLLCQFNNFVSEAKVTDYEYGLMPELFYLDDFDGCMSVPSHALYCSIVVKVSPRDAHNHSRVWNIIQDVIKDQRSYRHDLLRHGICVSKSCPNIDVINRDERSLKSGISQCYTEKLFESGLVAEVTDMHCETDQSPYPVDKYDIAVGIGLAILLWIVIFSTFYEGMARYKPTEEYEEIMNTTFGRIVACFSLRKNWSRLQSDNQDPEVQSLKAIQGIKFYNTQLVVLAHATMLAAAGPVLNPTFTETMTRKVENIIFINSYCIIQTFLLITGFLISYNFLKIFEKQKKFQLHYIILAFVNRYIRLTPCLLVMVALNATWFYHLGRGPMWNEFVGTEYRNCRKNWWTNLMYINNYYDSENMCMQHTWYLAADTQLFLVALLVVTLMWKYQHRIKLILLLSVAVGVSLPSIINYYNDYDIVIRPYPEFFYTLFLKLPHWHVMYASALTNYGAYALGLLFGYISYSRKNNKFLKSKIYVAVWWVLVWGLPLSVIFYGYLIYQDDFTYTRLGAAFYVSLQRNLFAFGLCIFVYGLTEGVGWFLRDCVLWSPLQVLGRLTYCTYLVHVALIRIRGGQLRHPIYLSNYTLFTFTVGDSALALIFGTILALFVELPVSALQKLMVPQLAKQGGASSGKKSTKIKQS